ncbi:MAG: prolipoprotein diacylglyceryl transferase [Proteobacteria bacterium]|nr:prolipoprotein diacylglyceryl transferase [Pseudomonadota bacterium]
MYAIAFPAIDPVAIGLGPIVIRWYSLAYIFGIVLGWRYAMRIATRTDGRIDRAHIDDFVVWATLGIILGGRLGYVLFYQPGYFTSHPLEIFKMWKGGMSFHGGVLGVLTALWIYCGRRQISRLSFADLICAAAPIGLFFGRIANFINGELFGRATDVPWAVVFPRGGPLPRHPSQLYEAALEGFALFIVLAALIYGINALRRPGMISGAFCAGYGIARFSIEFVREPDAHLGTLLGIATMGQLLSLPLIAIGLWLIFQARWKT